MDKKLKSAMKSINQPFKWMADEVMGVYGAVNFWNKRREAMRLWRVTGRQHFVIPTEQHTLEVVNKENIRAYNKIAKKKGRKIITHYALLKENYFMTPGGTNGQSEKRKPSFKNPKL